MDVTLYELGTSRSARCRWTLLEAGVAFESIEDRSLIGTDQLKAMQPLGKMPVAVIDGAPLFESAAICTHIADRAAPGELIAPSGTRDRALHDQWVSFGQSEMEAWLWHTSINTNILPEAERVPAVIDQNSAMFKRAAQCLEAHLSETDYLIAGRFSVTDIIVGWTVNWGRRQGHLDGCDALHAWLDRLHGRPHCALAK